MGLHLAAYFTSVITDLRAGFPIAALLFHRRRDRRNPDRSPWRAQVRRRSARFDSLRSLVAYVVIAVVLAPFASAFVAAFAGGTESYWFYWRVWFLSEALAYLVLAPSILTLIGTARTTLKHVSLRTLP